MASARWADEMADEISASYMTCRASHGSARWLLVSIRSASNSWSRLPQFTPMRMALFQRMAASIIWPNCTSRLSPLPTLPGLMRYLDNASAHAGWSVSKR